MKELLRKNCSCKRLFHRKVKPHTSRPTSKWILNLNSKSLTQQKKNNNNNNNKMKTTTTKKKTSKAKQTNKQTLNNKDPNKTRTYFDIKISILY